MKAFAKVFGGQPLTTYVECARRKDDVLFNFIAYGRTAKHAQSYLQPGKIYQISYDPFSNEDAGEYQGEITVMTDITEY